VLFLSLTIHILIEMMPARPPFGSPGETQSSRTYARPSAVLELQQKGPNTVTVAIDINPAVASAKAFLTDARARNGQLVKRKTWRPASELAVDLGTANTLVFVKGEGVVLNEPSVAAIDQATGNILGIGLEAKRMLGRTPEGVLAVRPMKDGVIADFHIAEKMLRHFLRMVIDRTILRVKPTVIVCVPSGITEVERRAVRDSAQSAGVKRLFMVAEPMAAAIGVGLPVETPVGSMVIDIGGGTTNIAVIALSGIVCDASIRTGGDELDQAIVQFMRKTYSLMIGEPTAERIKIGLGSAVQLEREGEMDVKGRDLVSGLPKTIRIDSRGVRDAIQEPVSHIINAVRRALEMTPPELASDVLEHGIMLTGGSSLIRGLDQRLMDETGLPVRMDEDPLTSVVRGTGRILDDEEKYWSVLST
jgi:rod shape-determining protein MreB